MEEIDKFLDLRITEREAIIYLKWFLNNTLDQYLDQNSNSIIKNLKKDNPPFPIKQFLLKFEKENKNRQEIIECLS
jgi:hypothetical protein